MNVRRAGDSPVHGGTAVTEEERTEMARLIVLAWSGRMDDEQFKTLIELFRKASKECDENRLETFIYLLDQRRGDARARLEEDFALQWQASRIFPWEDAAWEPFRV
jgi:hypothetical protein